MERLTRTELHELMTRRQGPCVSIVMPTHEAGRETRQDPIRFKNLLANAEEKLVGHGLRAPNAKEYLAPAYRLLDDGAFWRHQRSGLAVYLEGNFFRHFRVPLPVKNELVAVSERFHIKPLLPLMMSDGRFYVLAFSQSDARFYRGSRHELTRLQLDNLPKGLGDILKYTEYQAAIHFHPADVSPRGGGAVATRYHAQGEGYDVLQNSLLMEYWTRLSRGVEEYLGDEQAPLVLAALEQHQGHFRQLCDYPFVARRGIQQNPDALGDQELHQSAYEIVKPMFDRERQATVDKYASLAADGSPLAQSKLEAVVPAAHYGRVEALFVPEGAHQWGRFDRSNDSVLLRDNPAPGDEDLIDRAAAETLLNRGRVYVVRSQDLPGPGPVAAIQRYAIEAR